MNRDFRFHMNSIRFSQWEPLRCDKSVTDEQKDHNTLFYRTWHVVKRRCGGARMQTCTVLHFPCAAKTSKPLEISVETDVLLQNLCSFSYAALRKKVKVVFFLLVSPSNLQSSDHTGSSIIKVGHMTMKSTMFHTR